MLKRLCLLTLMVFAVFAALVCGGEKAKKIAFVYHASKVPFGEKLMAGFKAAVEERGGECILRTPGEPTAEAQIKIVKELAGEGVAAIGISANPSPDLDAALSEARRAGIKIVSADLPAAPGSRDLHVNPVDAELIGRTLVRGAFEMAGDAGELAILGSYSKSANQGMWIDWMKKELSRASYKEFKLVRTAYGDDDPAKAAGQAEKLLDDFPNLKVIVSPTTVGIVAAAKAVESRELGGKVLVTGLGFPSGMARFVESGVCPRFYLWNPEDIGYLAGHAAFVLADGAIGGTLGEYFVAGRLGARSVVQAGDAGTEVRIGQPFKFDKDNIGEWKNVY